ncbi:acyl carrier protein [Streptomyces sp. XY431]|uniref:acyl carrier protein n=1 Tax=Streptomyces sp. XY431 TaxID=1415562 RepID=UPI0006B02EA3|nr:acyl carrier protein [Streptomyces sp. XY431]
MNAVREHLVTLLTEKFEAPPGSIDDDATLEDLDLDSLARVELVFSLQDHWGVPLDDDQDSTADVTVGGLVDRIHGLLAQSGRQPGTSATSDPADAPDTSDTFDTSA